MVEVRDWQRVCENTELEHLPHVPEGEMQEKRDALRRPPHSPFAILGETQVEINNSSLCHPYYC